MARHIPRIYYDNCNINNNELILPERWNNHLIKVFRIKIDDKVIIYNKQYGEWLCNITSINNNTIIVKPNRLLRKHTRINTIILAFCLIKFDNIKLIIEKCTELGITDFYPLISDYTQYNNININKLNMIAIQASEQSERLDVSNIHSISNIIEFINDLPNKITWYSAIERISNNSNRDISNNNIGFIIGPEGGFSNREKELLITKTKPINLSSNILRAETACISCASIASYLNKC
ncbi:MAG: 16S rRNA (uracil(1498)-N(3))-methyltransferase [Alphaproteobacteria bacterium]|nr:16S rRNA (uracil(1498)-N(3))-methyltransferase [Alphaproteobacteria bacterium]